MDNMSKDMKPPRLASSAEEVGPTQTNGISSRLPSSSHTLPVSDLNPTLSKFEVQNQSVHSTSFVSEACLPDLVATYPTRLSLSGLLGGTLTGGGASLCSSAMLFGVALTKFPALTHENHMFQAQSAVLLTDLSQPEPSVLLLVTTTVALSPPCLALVFLEQSFLLQVYPVKAHVCSLLPSAKIRWPLRSRQTIFIHTRRRRAPSEQIAFVFVLAFHA